MSLLNVAHLGPTAYRDGLRIQEGLVSSIAAQRSRDASGSAGGPAGAHDWLLFPDHPPVLTVGRSPSEGNFKVSRERLAERGIEVFEVARGGDVTWHGPGQLVGYALCDLDPQGHDLHRFLREIEQALLDSLAGWGVEAHRVEGRTGIWAGHDKVASIGVAVRRWVTYHGFALNVCSDLSGFEWIHPCGLKDIRMTTLARLLGPRAPSLAEARRFTAEALAARLGYSGTRWSSAEAAWKAANAATAVVPEPGQRTSRPDGAASIETPRSHEPTPAPLDTIRSSAA